MQLLFASVLAVASVLVLVPAENPKEADFSCFSFSSSEAEAAAGVCGGRQRMGNVWYRGPNGSALVPCDSSSIFSSKCSVCLNRSARPETVLLVLWNLTGSEELEVKGPGLQSLFNRTDCPRPETIESNVGFHVSVSCFLLLLLFVTMWLICRRHGS